MNNNKFEVYKQEPDMNISEMNLSDIGSVLPLYIEYYNKHEGYYGKAGCKNAVNFVMKVKWF